MSYIDACYKPELKDKSAFLNKAIFFYIKKMRRMVNKPLPASKNINNLDYCG